ncbi:RagB/SusD family nutrient uptake outer membrane protein [Haliscomenobacter sp.]|uniref:RagB/SusD family nutrient uptake outer membrane protein n=1 Tax=Haliscomenobacter sp. TaxID=2717303 RepID=UPI003364D875
MKKYIFKIVLLFLVINIFSSCQENIELNPETALDGAQGFKTRQDVDAALIGCYSAVQSGNYMGLRYFALADLYSDILAHTGTFPSFAQFANRQLLTDNAELTNMWQSIYIGINRANTVIAASSGVTDPSFNVNNAIAEARILRAFHYFNLLRAFGGSAAGYNKASGVGVPLVTKPTLAATDAVPVARNTEAEVWTAILEDINFGVANLLASNGTGRVNKNVALALKARAHLYRGEWAEAEAAATQVIDSKAYTLVASASFGDVFTKKNSSEAIWELQFDINNTNSIAFFYYPTTLGGRNEIATTNSLRDAHEANDVRRAVNFTASPAGKTSKFTRVPGDDNVLLLRLAEMYLIRAEARANLSKLVESLADVNVIRTRAGLPGSTAVTAADLITAIEKERRIEFAHEGQRWFDQRRFGKWNANGITQDFRALWPIPQREVDTSNKVIAQNTGY